MLLVDGLPVVRERSGAPTTRSGGGGSGTATFDDGPTRGSYAIVVWGHDCGRGFLAMSSDTSHDRLIGTVSLILDRMVHVRLTAVGHHAVPR